MVSEITETIFTTLEKNLQKNEEQYRQLINAMPDVLYSYSLEHGGIFFSPAVFNILGYTPEYLLEHPFHWQESIHPEDRASISAAVRDCLLGKQFELAYRIRHAKGHWVWLGDRSVCCHELDGDFIVQGIATDITQRKESDQQLNHDRDLAEEGNRLKDQLLDNISNEMKKPVNTIINMTRILRSTNLSTEQQSAVNGIDQAVARLLELHHALPHPASGQKHI